MSNSAVYLAFTDDTKPNVAADIFTAKFGYKPSESFLDKPNLLKLGPVYKVHSAASESLAEGDSVLIDGAWLQIALIEQGNIVTESGEYMTLPASVTVRE